MLSLFEQRCQETLFGDSQRVSADTLITGIILTAVGDYCKSVFAFFCIALIVGGYKVFNFIFPKARPIRFPTVDSISVVYTSCNSTDRSNEISEDDYTELIGYISNAKSTRKLTLNEEPRGYNPYYMVEILTSEAWYRFFVYKEGIWTYIELPYEGVYRVDKKIMDLVLKYQ